MLETRKAMRRRMLDSTFPWRYVFKGVGLDIGPESDPLPGAIPFQLADGGGDDLTKFFPGAQLDFIHGSQVLEHALDPVVMLRSWIALLKPGGYIIASTPSWELYEKRRWPSLWNAGHVSTWSMEAATSPAKIHCKLPEWLKQFDVTVLRCALVDTNYNYSLDHTEFDQTFDASKNVEAFCEFVLEKL